MAPSQKIQKNWKKPCRTLALTAALAAMSAQAFAAASLSVPGEELFDRIPGEPAPTIESEEPALPELQATTQPDAAAGNPSGPTEATEPTSQEGAEDSADVPKSPGKHSRPVTLFGSLPGAPGSEAEGTEEPSDASAQTTAEETAKPQPKASKDTLFTVDEIRLDADELALSPKEKKDIDAIFAEALHHEQTLADLNRTIGKVTSYCRSHGYPASAVYLPAQESRDGVITVKVIPGRYGVVKFENHSKLKESVANRFVTGLKAGEIIRGKELESTLYSISDVSGTRAVGVLSPGKDFGTSDVTIRIEDGKQANTILYVENYGSKNSGRYRYGLQQSFYDISGTGAKSSLGTLISNSHMHNYYANYELPVGRGGQTLGFGVSQMDYKLGGPFRSWGAHGKALTFSLFGQLPFYHTHDGQLKLTYGYDYRKLDDELDKFEGQADSKKHTNSVHVGIAGSHAAGGTSIDYDATLTEGNLGLDSDYARTLDGGTSQNAPLHTSGSYTKLTADGTLVQTLGHRTDIMVKGSVQFASKNLDSSEQMYLGGANAIRAYPQGEGSGDDGWLGTAELRYYTPLPGIVFSTYFDAGHVDLAHDGHEGNETLKGWGVALSYTKPGDWFARLDYARRIGENKYLSDDAKANGRLWFILGKIW